MSPDVNTDDGSDVIMTPVPQEEVPAGSAQVTVLSDPPGASILVDGVYVGKTAPDTVVLPFGRHTIEAECAHEKRVSQDVDIQGDTTVEMRLSHDKTVGRFLSKSDISKTGWAVVRASQQYVYILVNGKPANSVRYNLEGTALRDTVETPYVVFGLKEGLVPIKVEAGGMIQDSGVGYNSGEFPVVSGLYSWLRFMVNGNDQMDILSVKSDAYAGYPYSVDGYLSAGHIPETREWPASSNYVSVMTEDGYVSYQRDSMDRTLVIAEPRDVVRSSVSVSSSPSGADILVDGFPTGYTTPWTIHNVSDGFHKITVSKPGYLPSEKDIVISRDGGTVSVSLPEMQEYSSGYLLVDSDEPGSYIMMYGKDTGDRTPVVYEAVPIGNRDITVVSGSGKSKTGTVLVLPDMMNELRVTFAE